MLTVTPYCLSIIDKNKCFEDEENNLLVTKSIMHSLRIRQGILVGEWGKKFNICPLKFLSSHQIPIAYKSHQELTSYIKAGSFPYVNTALIFKESNFLNLVKILKELEEVSFIFFRNLI